MGGFDGNVTDLTSCELYNPATGTWSYTGSMNEPHLLGTATLLQNGKVLVFGGENPPLQTIIVDGVTEYVCPPLFEIYDPSTGLWQNSSTVINVSIYGCSATLLPNGKVLIAGGNADLPYGGPYGSPNSYAELFDPVSDTWTYTGSMLSPMGFHQAQLLTNGLVLVAGGGGQPSGFATTNSELYNPTTETWANTGPYPALDYSSFGNQSALMPNGKVLVTEQYSYGGGWCAIYDPLTGLWATTNWDIGVGFNNTVTLLPSGRVFMAGGTASGSSTASYDPVRGEFKQTGNMITARSSFTSTLLTNGQVLIAGDYANCELYNPNGGLPVVMQNITRAASGAFQFNFTNTPSLNFGVLATTNLSIPIANWPEIGIISDSGVGQYQFSDIQATNYPSRFYELNPP